MKVSRAAFARNAALTTLVIVTSQTAGRRVALAPALASVAATSLPSS